MKNTIKVIFSFLLFSLCFSTLASGGCSALDGFDSKYHKIKRKRITRIPSGSRAWVNIVAVEHERDHSIEPIHQSLSLLREVRDIAYKNRRSTTSCVKSAYSNSPRKIYDWFHDQLSYIIGTMPTRGGIKVFENEHGYTMGMGQAEFALFLLGIAVKEKKIGNSSRFSAYTNLAFTMLKSFDRTIQEGNGGARGPASSCGPTRSRKRSCYFFSARGMVVPNIVKAHYVLNQNLHVIRDQIEFLNTVFENKSLFQSIGKTAKSQVSPIINRVIGGLYHLAFATSSSAIPSLAGFMNNRRVSISGGRNPVSYSWSFYEYDLESDRMKNISHSRTCHYHFHSVKLMAEIHEKALRNSSAFSRIDSSSASRVQDSFNKLFKKSTSSKKEPLYEFVRSAYFSSIWRTRQKCTTNSELGSSMSYYKGLWGYSF